MIVLVEPTADGGYRATCGEPIPTAAEGATRDEAVARLRETVAARLTGGAELVRLPLYLPTLRPDWPDDDVTRNFFESVAEYRRQCDEREEPWAELGAEAAR